MPIVRRDGTKVKRVGETALVKSKFDFMPAAWHHQRDVMEKVRTAQEVSRRLEAEVARHGCCGSCDLCADFDTCLVPPAVAPALPAVSRSALGRTDTARERREALERAQAGQFDYALPCY